MTARQVVPAVVFALLAGCATAPSEHALRVTEADAQMVAGCRYVGEVDGVSAWSGPGGKSTGINNARNSARDKAADLGATHVVWNPPGDSYSATLVSGKAYRCAP